MDSMPFVVQAHNRVSLTDQVYQGIVQAIRSGRFAVGGQLPSLAVMSRALSVSQIVVRRAVSRLASEGYVRPRQGRGIEVLARDGDEWRCQVLHLHWAAASSWFFGSVNGILLEQLQQRRILALNLLAESGETTRGFPRMRELLAAHPVGLAIVQGIGDEAPRLLAERRIPFIHLPGEAASPLAQGVVTIERDSIGPHLARFCLESGVRRVTEVSGKTAPGRFDRVLAAHGLEPSVLTVRAPAAGSSAEGLERASLEAVTALLEHRPWPELLYFDDDFLARGGLTALLCRGVKIPAEMQVICWSNRGHGPVFPVPLTRFEFDPANYAQLCVEMVECVLAAPSIRQPAVRMYPRFVGGQTTRLSTLEGERHEID